MATNDSGVHFSPETFKKIEDAETVLSPLGISTNSIIDQSVSAGIAAVVRKHRDQPARVSISDQVKAAVLTFNGYDITTQAVIDKLKEGNGELDVKAESVSKFLARLAERGIVRALKSKPKATAGRTKVVYRLAKRPK
jgi:hypothetical protein